MLGLTRCGRLSKPVAIVAGILAVLTLGILLTLVGANFTERPESFYPSLADARSKGAVDRGWIPEFLPASSRSIHELHDLDTNQGWCAFEFLPSEPQLFWANTKPVDALPDSVRQLPAPGVAWWPSVLVGDLNFEQIRKAGFDLYLVVEPANSGSRQTWLFAVDSRKGRGFFYSFTFQSFI